ncbi:DAK2 domain-containing protein [Corynebacterium afermentans]|uniref:DAK2 domain-containing protein n=1 Tax=Corynebacterium afermentans TaxID=38286 RepID=UPI000F893BAB|nr:DAK2 domain-containing protein [Corynebacterium afermentans]MCG7274829.1 DAK2 domain-containing protein [Corynebacterium afermentans]RUQ11407.1 DAK2 domain-containing protein [Corynebacterium genitalium]
MSASPLSDGARLLAWARRASGELERKRAEINELNVFPVPDGDTGSNMAHTMAAAVEAAAELPDGAGLTEVAEALAVGAVRGARGNSGVVLSQILRGFAQAASYGATEGEMLAVALTNAVGFVDRAIAEPVEGTIITVLRAAADAARPNAHLPLVDVAAAATAGAQDALRLTQTQLPALHEAGVVDAGGAGLVAVLGTLTAEEEGEGEPEGVDRQMPETHGTQGELEVMFSFRGDLDALKGELAGLGDSLIIAPLNDSEATVHIHSRNAGKVIETAFSAGEVSDLRLEVLTSAVPAGAPERLIIAVTPPGSVTSLYAASGAATVVPGPNVAADMLDAITRSGSNEVIVLPNGQLSSSELAAVENAARAVEQSITILPTVRLVSGIAALSVHDPAQPLATAAFTMSEAAGEMRTALAFRAEKGALTLGGAVAKGDVVVTSRGEHLLIADEPMEAVESACRRLLEHGGEQVSVLFDPSELRADALEELAGKLGVDVMVYPADGLQACAEIGVE